MPIVDSELAPLRDPRLAALATSAWPAWLWSADGTRILWANAVGAAIFGATRVGAFGQRRFKSSDASATQVIRLGATLPSRSQERLERLRAFGAGFGRALTCVCSRIVLEDGRAAVLIIATEAAGPVLTLGERVQRLFADSTEAIAAFGPDGALVYANAAALARLGGSATLAALGLAGIVAPDTGTTQATAQVGEASVGVTAEFLGKDNARVLLLTLAPQPLQPAEAQRAEAIAEAVPESVEPALPAPVPYADIAPPPVEPMATPTVLQDEPVAEPTSAAIVPQDEPVAELASIQAAPIQALPNHEPIVERRHPLRFVWHMDADERFVVGSDEFIELAGPRTMATVGRRWSEITSDLNLDPDDLIARAIATHETWSCILVSWPVDDANERLPVELSGLPVFDRDRSFRGYRGFGVCRDIDRINGLARERRERHANPLPALEAPQHPIDAAAAPPVMAAPETIEQAAAANVDEPAEAAAPPERPAVNVAPGSANVVPFRQSQPAEPKTPPTLSPVERRAFRELAQELTARLRGPEPANEESAAEAAPAEAIESAPAAAAPSEVAVLEQTLLDRIPIGVVLYRYDSLLYANRHFLEWSGYENVDAIEKSGGLNELFAGPAAGALADSSLQTFSIRIHGGYEVPAEGRMFTVPWQGSSAIALVLTNGQKETVLEAALEEMKRTLAAAETETREIKSILDTLAEGVITLDPQGAITGTNARAAALFGKAASEMTGRPLGEFLAPESARVARDYLDRAAEGTDIADTAIDIAAYAGENRLVPLAMTLTHIGSDRFAAMFRDTTAHKLSEEELRTAKREAVKAAAAKNEFLAKVSHEIRTPLNAMTGFAEVIMAERFGPIGNERYREYVKDIHAAGTDLVSMLNDLLDLSRIESGKAELSFVNVSLNDLTQQCVGIMQPQANKARIIIRTALTPALPHVVADERSLRQIVLNLLSNSIRLTGPGGQVIVSTVFSDAREAVLRVRDTGAGMSEKDIQAALEPFQQTATSGSFGSGGTGFGLPLTKAIAEANRANFSISSAPNAGTLVEIAFPLSRVVAE